MSSPSPSISPYRHLGMGSATLLLALVGVSCSRGAVTPDRADAQPADATASAARVAAASEFVDRVDRELRAVWVEASAKEWAMNTNITPETEAAASKASEAVMAYQAKVIKDAREFDGLDLPEDTQRKLDLIRVSTVLPAPDDVQKREELAGLSTAMSSFYGKAKSCREVDGVQQCRDLGQLMEVMAESRDYDELAQAWSGWRSTFSQIRPKYARFVEVGNEGARGIGFGDVGELWRSQYDMPPQDFAAEMDRLWGQVKPLYDKLHCHVRAKLSAKYGSDKVPAQGLIPAHILGNMWAQEWGNIYELMEPHAGQPSIDVTAALQERKTSAVEMVQMAEGFFTSLGLDPLPHTFWQRSMFVQPEDRDVVCHASAWDVGFNDDLRIKMCIKPTMEDLITVHHELGHNYYFHYYHKLPILYQNGAHDGFHEGIGDTLALSVTPAYLQQVGLLGEVSSDPKAVINSQMQSALDKIAFLPFGLLIDRWRWGVFSGEVAPENYNAAWWQLRAQYQGIAPPSPRSEANFDPGAKYHIPGNTPYSRYFLARILQFQFHRALCQASGHEGPLHTCSIYGSKAAGDKLRNMLAMGSSKPWPDALEAISGQREMDASAIVEHYQPLMAYLDQETSGQSCGWSRPM